MIEIAPRSKKWMTYEEAILYCQFLDHDGHQDWRMPTRQEYREYPRIGGWFIDIKTYPNDTSTTFVMPVRDI